MAEDAGAAPTRLVGTRRLRLRSRQLISCPIRYAVSCEKHTLAGRFCGGPDGGGGGEGDPSHGGWDESCRSPLMNLTAVRLELGDSFR